MKKGSNGQIIDSFVGFYFCFSDVKEEKLVHPLVFTVLINICLKVTLDLKKLHLLCIL